MATRAQTPVGRGFVSSLGYFHSENDYFTQQRAEGCGGEPFVDLWEGLTELGTTENDVYTPLFLEDVKDTLRDHVNKAIRTFDPWIHTTGMRAFRPV